MKNRTTTVLAMIATLAAAPLGAQGRGRNTDGVPPGQRPPAGMCRIWIDGVPSGQQPAPTDCATAIRNRPSNGRVIFGDQGARAGSAEAKGKGRKDDRRDDDRDDERRDATQGTRIPGGTSGGDRDGGWRWDGHIPRPSNLTGSSAGTAQSLPLMSSAAAFGRGQRTADVSRWLGTDRVSPRLLDVRDGRPQRVDWYDASGQLRQIWFDTNRDGRADRVDLYENGRFVRSMR